MAKITKRTVDAIKPDPDRDVLTWDDELSGFGVRCRPSGTKTYFLCRQDAIIQRRRACLQL